MRFIPLLIGTLLFRHICEAQNASFPIYLESGPAFNFLRKVPQNYPDSTDKVSILEIDKLKPLTGFSIGIVPEVKIKGRVFYKVGVVFSYLVSSAEMNSETDFSGVLVGKSTNIKSRFRNLYVQFPVELGCSFGRTKSFSLFSGVRLSMPLLHKNIWELSSISNSYDFSHFPPAYFGSDTSTYTVRPNMHSEDIAAEIGFMQRLSNAIILEERIYRGFTIISEFTEKKLSPALKQTTFEITLGCRLNKLSN